MPGEMIHIFNLPHSGGRRADVCGLDAKQVLGQPELQRGHLCQKQNNKTKCAVGTELKLDSSSSFFNEFKVKVSDRAFCTQEALGFTASTKKRG